MAALFAPRVLVQGREISMLSSVQRARSECDRPRLDGSSRGGALRVASLLLVALLAMVAAPFDARAEGGSYVDTDLLNLRSDPGTYGEVLDKLVHNEPIEVLDGPTDDGWYQVSYYGEVGWVYGGYISIDGTPGWSNWTDAVGGVASGSVWVDTDVLNIRSDATTQSDVLTQAVEGSELSVVGDEYNGFLPVQYDGVTGWASAGYLAWAPTFGPNEHWIDVDRSSQTVTLYIGQEAIASYWGSMGFDGSSYGFYSTALGSYRVYSMVRGLSWTPFAQAYIRYWVGFDSQRENGFHSYSMNSHGRLIKGGDGPTGGCVALTPESARAIYDFADYGMRVEVHW
jgi:uncharacterized protein YraI